LVVRHLPSGTQKTVKWVKDYTMSRNGLRVGVNIKPQKKDSVATTGIGVLSLPDTTFTLISREQKWYGAPVFSDQADKMAFIASNDTVASGTKATQLYLVNFDREIFTPYEIAVTAGEFEGPNLALPHASDPEVQARLVAERDRIYKERAKRSLRLNQYSTLKFSHNGRRLIAGVGPVIAPDDTTLYDFETAKLDIWRWDSPMTPPQENKMVDQLRKLSLPVVIDLTSGDYNQTLITKSALDQVVAPERWDGDWALLRDPSAAYISRQWDYTAPEELYVVNVNNGERKKAGTSRSSRPPINL